LFLLSLTIRLLSPYLFNIEPYSVGQLVIWYSDLEIGFKTSIISSYITIIGFLIVFQGSHTMWKKEVTTNLRIKAAEEFSEVFQELQDCISQILSYADEVRFTHDLIKDNVNRTEIEFQISYVVKELPSFIENRSTFLYLSQRFNTLRGKYSLELNSVVNADKMTNKVSGLLTSLTSYLYPMLPFVGSKSPDPIKSFSVSINIDQWPLIEQKMDAASQILIGFQELIPTGLKNPVISMNFSSLLVLSRNKRMLEPMFRNMDYSNIDSEIKKNNKII
jgi:hypothetical protein